MGRHADGDCRPPVQPAARAVNALHRRLLRLESVNGRHVFTHLSDTELDTRLRAELAEWLRAEPDACPPEVRAEVAAFVAEGARP